MEKQEKVIRAFCNQIADHRTGSLTELAPRIDEKYRFAWRMEGDEGKTYYEIFQMEATVKSSGNEQILEDWRKLLTSDHFYYMCTKWFADGDVHKYFNPYDSPYDSYINFMNVMDNLRKRIRISQKQALDRDQSVLVG